MCINLYVCTKTRTHLYCLTYLTSVVKQSLYPSTFVCVVLPICPYGIHTFPLYNEHVSSWDKQLLKSPVSVADFFEYLFQYPFLQRINGTLLISIRLSIYNTFPIQSTLIQVDSWQKGHLILHMNTNTHLGDIVVYRHCAGKYIS